MSIQKRNKHNDLRPKTEIVPEVQKYSIIQYPEGFCINDCKSIGYIVPSIIDGVLSWGNHTAPVKFATVKFNIRVLDHELNSILETLNLRHADHTGLCLFGVKFPNEFRDRRIIQLGTSFTEYGQAGNWQEYSSILIGDKTADDKSGLWLRCGASWGPRRVICCVDDIRRQYSGIPAGDFILTVEN